MTTIDPRRTRLLSPTRAALALALTVATACGEAPVREDELLGEAETEDAVRACPGSTTVEGIDVSHWQGNIDWNAVAASGKRFAIFKATEGTTYVDDTFAANWTGSKRAGLIRGAYHYFRPARDPIAQANFFADVMGPLGAGDLPPMMDLEETDGLSPARVADATRRFLDHLQLRTGRVPMIYTGYYFWRDQVGNPSGFSHYPLVMAAYVRGCPLVPDSWGRFTMWQYSSTGRVPGIRGNVDLDVFDGDMNALVALAQGTTQPTTPVPPAPTGCGIVGPGQVLARDQGAASCNGRFNLVHQGDGNVVLYDHVRGDAMWSTGTNGRTTGSFVMQGDGNLVLYTSAGRAVWSSGTYGRNGAYLVVQDDGNVVIYAPGHVAIWSTDTVRSDPAPQPQPQPQPQPPATPCGVAMGTTPFAQGQALASCDGRYSLVHQGDGNVVLYTSAGRALWSTGTNGRATEALVMQDDGNLVLYAPGGRAIWSTRTNGNPGAFLAVQDDGNVVIYRPTGRAIWATGTNR